jgi:hypothetical protein
MENPDNLLKMKKFRFLPIYMILAFLLACSSGNDFTLQAPAPVSSWPDSVSWWKADNLRLIQTNLPAYDATLNPDSLLVDLKYFSANTLIINAGGIMAFYPTELEYQYTNPYMQENMLGDVIRNCHEAGIRVMVRFDFSRAHESILKEHPEWFYISPKGSRINNFGMYTVSINAPYEQEYIFRIVEEVIDKYPIDGLFINMFGYQTWDPYNGVYHGIDQNPYEKKRFHEWSGGLKLPVNENYNNPVFQKYIEFKQFTTTELLKRLYDLVKSKNEQIAICTYRDEYVDIIRHETLTRELPYWPYHASDNVNHIEHSYPDHIVSNASIQQISFQSRYNAVEPEEVTIRLYQNIANGSGLDISLMGDFRDYEDERNYGAIKNVYDFHRKYEPYFGRYSSPAEIAVIAPGYWPGGESMEEYRGIQKTLKEAHLQFDIIENTQIGKLKNKIRKYRLIILPEINWLDQEGIQALTDACHEGTNLIATNHTLSSYPEVLKDLFGARIVDRDYNGAGNYLVPLNKAVFKRFREQTMLFWKYNLGLYDFSQADMTFLPILSKGRPGPPEMIGGHEPTEFHAMGMKEHPRSKAVLLPINLGRIYYLLGYEEHKNILLDVIDFVFPNAGELLQTNAHEKVEVILQDYILNIPENLYKQENDGSVLHLVNLTGYSGNTYFEPIPLENLDFRIRLNFTPSGIYSLVKQKTIPFSYENGIVQFKLDDLGEFDGLILQE